jgi:hypothetical protein
MGRFWEAFYQMSLDKLVRLNAREEIPSRGYRPLWPATNDTGSNPVATVAYMADGKDKDGMPSLRYITLLRDVAAPHSLPDHWVAFLNSIKPAKQGCLN